MSLGAVLRQADGIIVAMPNFRRGPSTPAAEPYPFHREVCSPLTKEMLQPLDPRCRTVQFKSLPTESDLKKIAQLLRRYPKVGLRAYGSYDGSIANLDFLLHFDFLEDFAASRLFHLDNIDGLAYLPPTLKRLVLGQTKKKLSLQPLQRFTSLHTLFLEGHTRDVEVISSLKSLQRLDLRSITLPDLSILTPLEQLALLAIKLGGTKNLDTLPQLRALVFLELWMIRGFSDLSPIADIASLESIFLQALPNVTALPDLSQLRHLTRVHLEKMSGLTDIRPLLTAPALTDLIAVDMGQLQPQAFAPLCQHPTLARASIGLGSKRKNDAVQELLALPPANRERHPLLRG